MRPDFLLYFLYCAFFVHLIPFIFLQVAWIKGCKSDMTTDEFINVIDFAYKLIDQVFDIIFGTKLLKKINGDANWKYAGIFIIALVAFSKFLDFVEKEGFYENIAKSIYTQATSITNFSHKREKKTIKDMSDIFARMAFDLYYNIPSGTITFYYIFHIEEIDWLAVVNVALSSISFVFVLLKTRKSMNNKMEFILLSSLLWITQFILFFSIPLLEQFAINTELFLIIKICIVILIIFIQFVFLKYTTCYLTYQIFPKELRTITFNELMVTSFSGFSDGFFSNIMAIRTSLYATNEGETDDHSFDSDLGVTALGSQDSFSYGF
jgi:hypothetical protein